MMSRVIYLSGSVSDGGTLGQEERDVRIAMFAEAAEAIRRGVPNVEVLNPCRHGSEPGATWQHYMRLALLDLARCDVVVLLPGWEKSAGARTEFEIAQRLGFGIVTYAEFMEREATVERPARCPGCHREYTVPGYVRTTDAGCSAAYYDHQTRAHAYCAVAGREFPEVP